MPVPEIIKRTPHGDGREWVTARLEGQYDQFGTPSTTGFYVLTILEYPSEVKRHLKQTAKVWNLYQDRCERMAIEGRVLV